MLSGLLAVAVGLRLTACADSPDPTAPAAAPLAFAVAPPVVFVGAGDIAHCGTNQGDEKTAALINGVIASAPNVHVFALGDVVYEDGTAAEFANCYDPSWGEFKSQTRPAIGNHEYNVSSNPYFDYFGEAAAGERGKGYYSYDLDNWHVVVLNSNASRVPTAVGSAQDTWLKSDLAATSKPCVLAFWHHARFASAVNSTTPTVYAPVKPFWDALYAAKADVILVSHQHFYERFALMAPDGALDTQNGIRQIVVGTGGKSTGANGFQAVAPNSVARNTGKDEFGVLKMTLGAGTYSWEFIPVPGKTYTDSGTGTCHPKNPTAGTLSVGAGDNQSAAVGTGVATRPSVEVTDANGNPVSGLTVTFTVTSGGGTATGTTPTTSSSGIATVGSWTLGTTAGPNTLRASATGYTPLTFMATGMPGPARAANSTATVPDGTVGSPTSISVQTKDQYGNNLTTGGATVVVAVTGANSATPTVTDNGNGTYTAAYTPTAAGTDQVAIALNGTAIGGSPYTSSVSGGTPTATTMVLNAGTNQSATVGTAVATQPSVRVADAGGDPVAGVAVTFAISSGGGSVTGGSQTTDANGIATVGSWTLGTTAGTKKLTASSSGLTGSPVTFTATATAGPAAKIAINKGDNQTAPAGTAVSTRPSVKVTDTYGNGVPNVIVTFAVASGGGGVTGAARDTGSGGIATVGSWTLGAVPATNTLTATASGTGIADNPVTVTATGN